MCLTEFIFLNKYKVQSWIVAQVLGFRPVGTFMIQGDKKLCNYFVVFFLIPYKYSEETSQFLISLDKYQFISAPLRSHKCPCLAYKVDSYVPFKPTTDSVAVILLTFIWNRQIVGDQCMFLQLQRYPERKSALKWKGKIRSMKTLTKIKKGMCDLLNTTYNILK